MKISILAVCAAVLALSAASVSAQTLPVVKFCSAKPGGNYDFTAKQVAMQAKGKLDVQNINTNGSLDNLAKLDSGECDVAIIQSDAFGVYKAKNGASSLSLDVGAKLYKEVAHLVCNTTPSISKITGLNNKSVVFVGANGGGSSVTWDNFVLSDKARYGVVETQPLDGVRAINKVVLGDPNGSVCMLFVAGLKTKSIMEANVAAVNAPGKIALVATNDSDLLKLKVPGKNGGLVYSEASISGDTYPKGLIAGGWVSSGSIQTVAVDALFVASTKYIDVNSAHYDDLLTFVNRALPAIVKQTEPPK